MVPIVTSPLGIGITDISLPGNCANSVNAEHPESLTNNMSLEEEHASSDPNMSDTPNILLMPKHDVIEGVTNIADPVRPKSDLIHDLLDDVVLFHTLDNEGNFALHEAAPDLVG